jgi:4-hydroxy-4-methyl-2-oxoglutarate aldolase
VRDIAEIIEIGLPVFCRGAAPATCFTNGPGEVGLPIAMGEVAVRAGDLVMGDRDGVLIVARERVEEVTGRLEEVAAKEAGLQRKIADGTLGSMLDFWPKLKDEITYVD